MKNASTQAHYRQIDAANGSNLYDKYVAKDYSEWVDKLVTVNEKLTVEQTDCLFGNATGVKSFGGWLIGTDQK